jgi:hypothetical protein
VHELREFIEIFVQLWHEGLTAPAETQAHTLSWLLEGYAQTSYGQRYGATDLLAVRQSPAALFKSYQDTFPIVTYDSIRPWIDRVVEGEVNALLPEPPIAWAMTRGTTRGVSKRIPITEPDLGIRVAAARALLHHLLRTNQLDAIDGYCLNLNYPSVVGTLQVSGKETPCGYSSGIYVRHAAEATPVQILPAQEEIDALGGANTQDAWERRFELVYQHTKTAPITMCAGVCPSIIEFGRFLQRRHRVLPKDLWRMRVIAATSVPGILTKYKPALQALYGPADIVEMYIATEGTFAQQRDERRLLVPNFDLYLFEVLGKDGGVKLLHEMRPGEYGSLIVSTPVLPRYRIGDLVRAFDPPYFRCIGREGRWTRIRYWFDGLLHLDFGQA